MSRTLAILLGIDERAAEHYFQFTGPLVDDSNTELHRLGSFPHVIKTTDSEAKYLSSYASAAYRTTIIIKPLGVIEHNFVS